MTATISKYRFSEHGTEPKTESVGLSHLSLELGHLYMEDFDRGDGHLSDVFGRVVPGATAARNSLGVEQHGSSPPRVSTCFLIDDYFSQLRGPREILDMVTRAAEKQKLTVDYIARESACAEAGGVKLAQLVFDRLVAEPPPSTNGSRPPIAETFWLPNGRRSPNVDAAPAMTDVHWQPALQSAANRHSIFVDVELRGGGKWSCSFLAAVWQLLRLGLLRDDGRKVADPVDLADVTGDTWAEMPAVIRMNKTAHPFSAFRTHSILASRFLDTELAARIVLGQVPIAPKVASYLEERRSTEGVELPADILDRIGYTFLSD